MSENEDAQNIGESITLQVKPTNLSLLVAFFDYIAKCSYEVDKSIVLLL